MKKLKKRLLLIVIWIFSIVGLFFLTVYTAYEILGTPIFVKLHVPWLLNDGFILVSAFCAVVLLFSLSSYQKIKKQ